MSPSVVVVGASGYAGAIAARILWRHPEFEILAVTAREDAGRRLSDLYPHHRVPLELEPFDIDRAAAAEAAIVAYPHGTAAPVVAELLARDVRVVDLSADFRLRDVAAYEHWYVPHPHPELIPRAVYGLTELYREQIAEASLVACPGCFPTAAILALAPLAAAGLIADVVIDAKTGVSGMGKQPRDRNHFVAVTENVRPYGVGAHRHMPEIDQELGALGAPVPISFTPHLLPIDQGELLSCYVTPTRPLTQAGARSDSTPSATTTSPSSSSSRARRACATCARPTSARSTSTPMSAPASCSCSRPSTTSGRGPPRRRSPTST